MNILIDLQHPAHLHFFRPLVSHLEKQGHQIYITARDKDILVQLAQHLGIPIDVFGKARKGIFHLAMELIFRQWRLHKVIRRFKPHIIMAIAGTFISFPGYLHRIPTYIFYDTEHAVISNLLAYPFATCIYVPQCYRKKIRWNHIRYNGYHEIAYLHPHYFKPDPSVLELVGVKPGEIFTLVRFVSWQAGHDIGLSGLTKQNKIKAIQELSTLGRVFISSEGQLAPELEKYKLNLDITKIHSLMAYAALIFGESATMISEGAVLGVPGVYIDPIGRGYTDEQENQYGIVYNFTPKSQLQAIEKAVDILRNYQETPWRSIGQRIIAEKIDVTQMLCQVVEKHLPGHNLN